MTETNNASRVELDIVRSLDRFMRDDPALALRRGKTGRALIWLGAGSWTVALFATFNDVAAWGVGLAAGLGGSCLGVGRVVLDLRQPVAGDSPVHRWRPGARSAG